MLPLKLKPEIFKPTRRQFLLGAAVAGTGLSVSFRVPGARAEDAKAEPNPFNAYVTISPDNKVTILSAHMDMGQGAYHGIATLVAEELEADRDQLVVVGAAGNPEALRQPRLGRRGARHRRIVGDVLVVRPLPQGRRAGAHHAGQRRRQAVERSGRRDHRREGRPLPCRPASRRRSASLPMPRRRSRCRPRSR